MTKDEVICKWNGMSALERNVWVATAVMGYKPDRVRPGMIIDSNGYSTAASNYSEDFAAAGEVFEKIKNYGAWIEVAWNPRKQHYRGFIGAKNVIELKSSCDIPGRTAPEAICLPALISILTEEQEI
ncbi:hypothetical protein JOD82_002127 [Paenibacillus sp. 1182]|uniref:BC1872 family protein n=1 Tax=Paenibacillus sp. 1182 TaxID=2806565 RepID=UPI001B6B86E9|nr:hypothetical protein [Paenibacillus sp. 1182]MBP1309107.1 hypothetical protein [Paenibacillus sp. 1182]